MPISINEIKKRALAFCKEWEGATNEDAEAKEFLVQFLNIFGITRRWVAIFEHRVKKLDDGDGYIDLLWKGNLLVEMKSRGKDLAKAYTQAKDYCHGLKEFELPKIIMISDFHHFHIYDENGECTKFTLPDLVKYLPLFDTLRGLEKRNFAEQDPVNLAAAELMGKLHDKLKNIGYDGHHLEVYLVRLLFILFADDTGIFDRDGFNAYLINNTRPDGSDLAMHLSTLFDILNREYSKRLKNLDEDLARFPYVNGKLFEEVLPPASFDSDMRNMLLNACLLDWGKISPAIFGSLFQSVMDPKARRNLGAHYTSEKNIFKVIRPLFLDDLWAEFNKCRHNKNELRKLHLKISKLRFLDPACGCGNFLIITYREMRLLEMEIVASILEGQTVTDIGTFFLVDVDQFYGIEYEEFPSLIAQVALWLMDHQMNITASQRFGDYYVRLPLRKSATIVHGNALRMDWQSLLNKEKTINIKTEEANIFVLNEPELEYQKVNIYARDYNINPATPAPQHEVWFDFIMGNPPFIGKQYQNENQKGDLEACLAGAHGTGVLDYVSAWFVTAAKYMQNHNQLKPGELPKTVTAFVSTNSITQGEQVGILWNVLFNKYHCKIHFAHPTFKWGNEAKANAAVHVVIIGFSNYDKSEKILYDPSGLAPIPVKNINPYLVQGRDNFLIKRRTPISNVQEMVFGNMPNDGGYFLFEQQEMEEFLKKESMALKYFRKFIGGQEFISGTNRWCLWLPDADPKELQGLPMVKERIDLVRQARKNSKRPTTQKLASFPTLFGEIRQPKSDYLVLPEVSSERRDYIPIGFMKAEIITSNKNYTISEATLFTFGILASLMHMAWVRSVAGRMKSDYSYSAGIVYNNFPWPPNPTEKQKQVVEAAAQAVLDARLLFPNSSLADLYDPTTMPTALVKAHQALDKAVDLCYRPQPFPNETKRIEYLFELYDQYTAGLFKTERKRK